MSSVFTSIPLSSSSSSPSSSHTAFGFFQLSPYSVCVAFGCTSVNGAIDSYAGVCASYSTLLRDIYCISDLRQNAIYNQSLSFQSLQSAPPMPPRLFASYVVYPSITANSDAYMSPGNSTSVVYMLGGQACFSSSVWDWTLELWRYTPSTNTWQLLVSDNKYPQLIQFHRAGAVLYAYEHAQSLIMIASDTTGVSDQPVNMVVATMAISQLNGVHVSNSSSSTSLDTTFDVSSDSGWTIVPFLTSSTPSPIAVLYAGTGNTLFASPFILCGRFNVLAGAYALSPLNRVYTRVYDNLEQVWFDIDSENNVNAPYLRSQNSLACFNETTVYLTGGMPLNASLAPDPLVYTLSLLGPSSQFAWNSLTPSPPSICSNSYSSYMPFGHTLTAVNGYLVHLGGAIVSTTNGTVGAFVDVDYNSPLFLLDPVTACMTPLMIVGDGPVGGIYGHTATVFGGTRVYVFGGQNPVNTQMMFVLLFFDTAQSSTTGYNDLRWPWTVVFQSSLAFNGIPYYAFRHSATVLGSWLVVTYTTTSDLYVFDLAHGHVQLLFTSVVMNLPNGSGPPVSLSTSADGTRLIYLPMQAGIVNVLWLPIFKVSAVGNYVLCVIDPLFPCFSLSNVFTLDFNSGFFIIAADSSCAPSQLIIPSNGPFLSLTLQPFAIVGVPVSSSSTSSTSSWLSFPLFPSSLSSPSPSFSSDRAPTSSSISLDDGTPVTLIGSLDVNSALLQLLNVAIRTGNDGTETTPAVAIQSGTTAYLTKVLFFNARGWHGGALLLNGGTANIVSCSFVSNFACHGGAIYATGAIVTISNSFFSSNTASLSCRDPDLTNEGGAIYVLGTSATIIQSRFINNIGMNGALSLSSGSYVSIDYCSFVSNLATSLGGAIYSVTSSLIVSNSNFLSNTASLSGPSAATSVSQGGALYLLSSTVTLLVSQFTNNTATNGGAIAAAGTVASLVATDLLTGHQSFLTMTQCGFSNNRAVLPIPVFTTTTTATTTNTTATNTTVAAVIGNSGLGGAMYVTASMFEIAQCDFMMNQAAMKGGAVYTDSAIAVDSSSFMDNSALRGGGGVLFFDVPSTIGASSTFTSSESSASYPMFTNCSISGNTAVYGATFATASFYVKPSNLSALSRAHVSGALVEPAMQLIVYDAYDNVVTTDVTTGVSIASAKNEPPPFAGTLSVFSSSGVVSFDALTLRLAPFSVSSQLVFTYTLRGYPVTLFLPSPLSSSACLPGYRVTDGVKADSVCDICPVGSYSSTLMSSVCTPCRAGYYQNRIGASSCIACGPGTFSSTSGVSVCTACQAGQYSEGTSFSVVGGVMNVLAATACSICGPGKYQGGVSASACVDCEIGKAQSSSGKAQCQLCATGTYTFSTGQASCSACQVGLTCVTTQTSNNFTSLSGFYVSTMSLSEVTRVSVTYCPPTLCLDSGLCANNRPPQHSNVMCGACNEGSAYWLDNCVPCTSPNVGLIILLLLMGFFYMFIIHLTTGPESSADVQILVYFVQTVLLQVGSFSNLLGWMSVFTLDGRSSSPGLTEICIAPLSAYGNFVWQLSTPFVYVIQLSIIMMLHYIVSVSIALSPLDADNKDTCLTQLLRYISSSFSWSSYLRTFCAVYLLIFQNVTTLLINFLHCITVPLASGVTLHVVYAWPAIECTTASYSIWRVLSIVLLVVFVVIIPGSITWHLHSNSKHIKNRIHADKLRRLKQTEAWAKEEVKAVLASMLAENDVELETASDHKSYTDDYMSNSIPSALHMSEHQKRKAEESESFRSKWGLLYECNTPACFYWTLLILFRRMIVIILTVLFSTESNASRFIAYSIFNLCILFWHTDRAPYLDPWLNRAEAFSLCMLLLTSLLLENYVVPFPNTVQVFLLSIVIVVIGFIGTSIVFRKIEAARQLRLEHAKWKEKWGGEACVLRRQIKAKIENTLRNEMKNERERRIKFVNENVLASHSSPLVDDGGAADAVVVAVVADSSSAAVH